MCIFFLEAFSISSSRNNKEIDKEGAGLLATFLFELTHSGTYPHSGTPLIPKMASKTALSWPDELKKRKDLEVLCKLPGSSDTGNTSVTSPRNWMDVRFLGLLGNKCKSRF